MKLNNFELVKASMLLQASISFLFENTMFLAAWINPQKTDFENFTYPIISLDRTTNPTLSFSTNLKRYHFSRRYIFIGLDSKRMIYRADFASKINASLPFRTNSIFISCIPHTNHTFLLTSETPNGQQP